MEALAVGWDGEEKVEASKKSGERYQFGVQAY